MKIRLADYVAEYLVDKGVTDVFSVVGGGAMHLNDALGHNTRLHVTYNHHEQASAMAAESYARLENRAAAVCVTTGPGGTNALTGVLCAWLDSLPMFVISGQVRYDTTARFCEARTGMRPRAVGDQEYDITLAAREMTKYAVMIEDPRTIRYHLDRAWEALTSGRPGPVWIDIPVNFQGMEIDTDEVERVSRDAFGDAAADDGCSPSGMEGRTHEDFSGDNPPEVSIDSVREVINEISSADRPVLYAGYGIRLAGAYDIFRNVIEKLGIPVVTYWNAIDLIEDDHPLYAGRAGNMGDRPGNWAIQNADLILAVGTRISIRQVGYNRETWARAAKVIMVDIDEAELSKPTIHVDMKVHADAKDFLSKLSEEQAAPIKKKWLETVQSWKKSYPVVQPHQWEDRPDGANVYAAFKYISDSLPEGSLTAVSNGACCVAGHQVWTIKKGTRFHNNSAVASMGYGLPAAIGACISAGRKDVICLEGDGSIMMNLQELQTIVTNRLPIKIFLINNSGYHSIRITQSNLFAEHEKIGIGPESGDLSFPEFRKIADAFGIPYFEAHNNSEMKEAVGRALGMEGYVLTEIFTDTEQRWEPKSSARRLPDGTLVSPPLEDLAPFLPREELEKIMIIPMVEE